MIKSIANRVALLVSLLVLTACDLPPMDSDQKGFRGTGMVEIDNPEDITLLSRKNQMPELNLPIMPALEGSPLAGDVYKNVQILNDVPVPQFVSLMVAMAEWVAPEGESCNYCHVDNKFADDSKYTKVVARSMIDMTRTINAEWQDHVGSTGITCYTCHRGNPVPEYLWFKGGDRPDTSGMAASRLGQNLAARSVASASLPYDPFTALIESPDGDAKVAAATALPTGKIGDMRQTESTYALMMHMSDALGVNCTHCHNSRAFSDWSQSNPARVQAWYGIRMARQINNEFMAPLQPVYPANRLGPSGDAGKANCSTCHQGIAKPLYGASVMSNYPALMARFNYPHNVDDSIVAYSQALSRSPDEQTPVGPGLQRE